MSRYVKNCSMLHDIQSVKVLTFCFHSDEEGGDAERFKLQTAADNKTKNVQRQADVMRNILLKLQNQVCTAMSQQLCIP